MRNNTSYFFYYSLPRYTMSLMQNAVNFSIFYIYRNLFLLGDIETGLGIFIGRIVIGIASLLFGYMSDKTNHGIIGRRKTYVGIGMPLLIFSFFLMFNPYLFLKDTTYLFTWFLITVILFNLFYGLIVIPYQAWMMEITEKTEDRMVVSSIQQIMNTVGSFTGIAFALIMIALLEDSLINPSFIIAFLAIGISGLVLMLPSLFKVEDIDKNNNRTSILSDMQIIISNRNYLWWLISLAFSMIGVFLLLTVLLDIIQLVFHVTNSTQQAYFAISFFIGSIISYIFWTRITVKRGKITAIIGSYLLSAITLPFINIINYLGVGNFIFGYLFGFIVGISLGVYYVFIYTIIADFSDKDEQQTGVNRSGSFTGISLAFTNIFQAIGGLIAGLLASNRFIINLEHTTLITSFFLLVSIIFIKKSELKNM